ncbi:MAG: membrane fusion protein (multidrug efflux system) [Paracoccaceae bacterium]|jgi:membrane fusion protein (multidrug efflux system)
MGRDQSRTKSQPLRLLFASWVALAWLSGGALAQEAAPKPVVTVAEVQFQAVAESETFTGRIEAVSRVVLMARVPGFIQSIGFAEGQNVSKEDTLFSIEPDAYQAAVTQILGQKKSVEATKTLADLELTRQQTLFEKQDVAERTVQEVQAKVGQIEGQLLELQGSLQIAQLDLSYTAVTAPFDGRVGLTDIAIGTFVSPDSGGLVTLSSIDPIYATFSVAESVLLDFSARQTETKVANPLVVQLTLANRSVYAEQGKIEVVDTQVQAGTDSVLIRALFTNANGVLLDGQLVQVGLIDQTEEKSLTIPVQALQKDQGGYFVLVVDSAKKVEKRPISLGRIAGTTAIVADGLKQGEQVITEGAQRAQPGRTVDPQSSSVVPAAAKE